MPERGQKNEVAPRVAGHQTPEERMLDALLGALWQVEVQRRFGVGSDPLVASLEEAAA